MTRTSNILFPMNMAVHPLLSLAIFLLFLLHHSCSSPIGYRVDLRHVDAGAGFTKKQLIERAALRSKSRGKSIINGARIPVQFSELEYMMELAIGTPPLWYTALVDTGSDLVWTQCKPCKKCGEQPTPLFDPSRSPSFSKLSCNARLCRSLVQSGLASCNSYCNFDYHYVDNSSTNGFMGFETFTFGSHIKGATVSVPHIGFGCATTDEGALFNGSGVVGFGMGDVSLPSQLGVKRFSLCLAPFSNENGTSAKAPLFFGHLAKFNPKVDGPAQSTPIYQQPSFKTTYSISLKGITIGKIRLPIPSSAPILNKYGFVIDSGTAFLQLPTVVYKLVDKYFTAQMKLQRSNRTEAGTLEICFAHPVGAPLPQVPKMVIHLEDADLDLPLDNYLLIDDDDKDGGLACLLVQESLAGDMGLLGNIATQNIHVLYDVEHMKVSFAPSQCDRL